MKIRLLNNDGRSDMDDVAFPAEVEARYEPILGVFMVLGAEIIRVGAPAVDWDPGHEYAWGADKVGAV